MKTEQFKMLHPKLSLIPSAIKGIVYLVGYKVLNNAEKTLTDYAAKTITTMGKHIAADAIKLLEDIIIEHHNQQDNAPILFSGECPIDPAIQ